MERAANLILTAGSYLSEVECYSSPSSIPWMEDREDQFSIDFKESKNLSMEKECTFSSQSFNHPLWLKCVFNQKQWHLTQVLKIYKLWILLSECFISQLNNIYLKFIKLLILPSIANEVLKAVVAQYDADQLIKMREKISQEIKEGLIERAKEFKIVLEDVSITHLGFMKEYAQAIEAKQVAQQLAERQKFIVLRDEEEKNAKIILSEGESEAARLINDAVKSYGTAQIEIKKLETAKHIAETLAKSPNISWIPTGNGVSNLLNLKTF
ncbi:unnamed protein product (macronuclear) [Paramecium tetraurelia]|uniref:Prohibitin n=1 Tax=Paramecium tetraurelia TaxID=5888 RepID=A0DN33_PARTE|nr:uncharacterized protein GSPATT00018655001 [Paramecium tetraurelia]CAK84450.1 unnamed protein product [Paramecium tetraurelia]|eukprot:XP_001451847.1 hypothetical protein (macronuclear) [Paramecium tetraurelia strain d4-2]